MGEMLMQNSTNLKILQKYLDDNKKELHGTIAEREKLKILIKFTKK